MPNSSSRGSTLDSLTEGGSLTGTVPSFAVGLVIVVVAGVLVGRRTGSYVAVAFAAYFLTTVYDLVVDRLGHRRTLLDRVRAGSEDRSSGD